MSSKTVINTYYPIDYFADRNIAQLGPNKTDQFWASKEKLPPQSDSIQFDLGRQRSVNFIDFEICAKPIDIRAYWQPQTVLTANAEVNATALNVDSTEGFPSNGVLVIDNQEIAYSGKTATQFLLNTEVQTEVVSTVLAGQIIHAPSVAPIAHTGKTSTSRDISIFGEDNYAALENTIAITGIHINPASTEFEVTIAGELDQVVGNVRYGITYLSTLGETNLSPASNAVQAEGETVYVEFPKFIDVANAIGIKIYRSTNGGPFGLIATINDGDLTKFADTGFTEGLAPPNSNTAIDRLVLPATEIHTLSTDGFAPSGQLRIGNAIINYTGIDGTSFIGVSGGEGEWDAGTTIEQDHFNIKSSLQQNIIVNTPIGTWVEFEPKEGFELSKSVTYLPSETNPWLYFELNTKTIQTRYVRLYFTRREERFPFESSDFFPWSIDIRNLRVTHIVATSEEYADEEGVDILGNVYRTDLIEYPPENVLDENRHTFWQSQPNPTRVAVENLYFDVRQNYVEGNMGALDGLSMAVLDMRTMSDMRTFFTDSVVLDEVYVDPITTGPLMHIYYSNDEYPDWDFKLWTPIPRNFILKRGYHTFPSPVKAKYIKLEFTNLAAAPYETAEYPKLPPIRYRRFPTWVQNHFNNIEIALKPTNDLAGAAWRVTIDPIELGFIKQDDRYDVLAQNSEVETDEENFEISALGEDVFAEDITSFNDIDTPTAEDQIEFFSSSFMYSQNLLRLLDLDRALSRFAVHHEEDVEAFTIEQRIDPLPLPSVTSATDEEEIKIEKEPQVMFFPRTCRHGYQVVEAQRTAKIAYFVSIKEVSFFRKDYTVENDDPIFIETFNDDQHLTSNTFDHHDWKLIVAP